MLLDIETLLNRIHEVCDRTLLASSTVRKNVALIRLVLSSVASLEARELQQFFHGKGVCNRRNGKPLTINTRNSIRSELKWFIRQVLRREIPSDLAEVLKKKNAGESCGRRVSAGELRDLLGYSPSDLHRLAFELIFASGMRPHELLSITVESVEFHKEYAEIAIIHLLITNAKVPSNRNKTGARPVLVQGVCVTRLRARIESLLTGANERVMHDHPRMRGVAGEHDSSLTNDGELFVFPWKHGVLSACFSKMEKLFNSTVPNSKEEEERASVKSISSQDRVKRRKKQKFKGRLYDLRHSAASELATKDVPDQLLRKTMGWSQASRMPNVYVHIDASDLIKWASPSSKTAAACSAGVRNLQLAHSSSNAGVCELRSAMDSLGIVTVDRETN